MSTLDSGLQIAPQPTCFTNTAKLYGKDNYLRKAGFFSSIVSGITYHVINLFYCCSTIRQADRIADAILEKNQINILRYAGDKALSRFVELIAKNGKEEQLKTVVDAFKHAFYIAHSKKTADKLSTLGTQLLSALQAKTTPLPTFPSIETHVKLNKSALNKLTDIIPEKNQQAIEAAAQVQEALKACATAEKNLNDARKSKLSKKPETAELKKRINTLKKDRDAHEKDRNTAEAAERHANTILTSVTPSTRDSKIAALALTESTQLLEIAEKQKSAPQTLLNARAKEFRQAKGSLQMAVANKEDCDKKARTPPSKQR